MRVTHRTTAAMALAATASPIVAAATNTTATAVFQYAIGDTSSSDGVLTYALFADKDSSTISFHLSAPAAYGWTAVGFGSQMKDALIFIAYPSGDKSGVTVSPRTADGHSEPSYLDKITCKPPGSTDGLAPGANTVSGDDQILSADVVCSGLDAWSGWKSLDFGSENSQFIFALGPDYGSHGPGSSHDKGGSWWASTSLSAGLQRHDQYGHFALSLKAASAGDVSAVPAPNAAGGSSYTGTAASDATGVKSDRDPAPIIHGLIMSLVWVIIFPVGAAVLKIMRKVLWHAACQGIGAVLFLMATAGGIKVSSLYNRSKHFSSPHQVIGILLLIAVILQFALGLVHHRLYKKNQQPTLMGKIHRYLGPVTMVIGLINGFIGFAFAGATRLAIPYAIIIIIIAIFLFTLTMFVQKRRARREKMGVVMGNLTADGRDEAWQQQQQQQPQFGPGGAQPAYPAAGGWQAPPPAYGNEQQQHQAAYGNAGMGVPLQPYRTTSDTSVPLVGQSGHAGVQPRTLL